MVHVIDKQKKYTFAAKFCLLRAQKMLKMLKLSNLELSIVLCGPSFIKKMNRDYRGKDKVTDILSFPTQVLDPKKTDLPKNLVHLGDLIICLQRAHKDSLDLNETLEVRLNKLLSHGISHLLGHSHETEQEHEIMSVLEKKLQAL